MDSKRLTILKFLSEQKEPVRFDDFPNHITSMFEAGTGLCSIYNELNVILRNKEWVKEPMLDKFIITENGKDALGKEIDIENKERWNCIIKEKKMMSI